MGKTAFISDIHGNAIALQAILEDIREQGCGRTFVLGDIINGMDPSKCITLLKAVDDITCIKGNAEHYVLTPDLDIFPHGDDSLYPDLLNIIQWWQQHMSKADFAFIQDLPDFLHLDSWYMVHDSPSDRAAVKQLDLGGIDEKYRQILFHGLGIPANIPTEELHPILKFLEEKHLSGLFIGHTHEPYVRYVNGKTICNTGSAGFTLDGDPRPSWVLCEGDESRQQLTVRRVAYDIDQAIHRLKEVGFMEFAGESRRNAYIQMLQTGIHWRSFL